MRIITVLTAADAEGIGALASCLRAQSLQSWEWVVLCESDAAAERLRGEGDARVRPLPLAEPVAAACNRAVAEAPGPFVCFLHPATTIEPTFLEKAAWTIGTNPAAALCNAQISGAIEPGAIWPYGFEQGAGFLERNFAGETFVARRDAYLDAGGLSPDLAPGYAVWELFLKLAARGLWGHTIAEPLIVRHGAAEPPPPDAELAAFRRRVAERYGGLAGSFPGFQLEGPRPYEHLADEAPLRNRLHRPEGARRLLILMPWLIVGGAERVNLDMIHYLTGQGYEISFATTLVGVQHNWIEAFARYTPDIFILDHFLRLPDFPRFLAALIASRGIDTVLISNSYLGYQLLPYLRAACPTVAFVDYCHSGDEAWNNGGYPRCGAAYQQLLDLNITSSEHIKRWMVGRGADPERIEVAYTNVDVERWKPDPLLRRSTRDSLALTDDQALIVFVGRVSAEKRPELLARIVAALRDEAGGRFLCLVIGDGPARPSLDALVGTLDLGGSLRVLGRVDDAQIYSLLAAADMLLLPSQTEGISVAVFEAMAMGVVPVSARVGGQAELVTPDCGFLIPHGPDEQAQYVAALKSLIADPELRRRMSAAARERVVKNFPLSAFGPRMAALFDRARELHEEQPRLPVSAGLGREHAVQAIEGLRIGRALEELWAEREQRRAHPPALTARQHAAQALRLLLAPPYHWALAHGMPWLAPLKRRLFALAKGRGG